MSRSVTVITGARLHFGLVIGSGVHGPSFGSVGVMVAEPGFTLQMEPSNSHDVVAAPSNVAQRIAEFLAVYRQQRLAPAVRIDVPRTIPEHAGLGSGTQLALAAATALTQLFDGEPVAPGRLAQMLGRGRRSSIGVVGFEHGGCVFAATGTPTQHAPLPEAWRFLLVTPRNRHGLSGAAEKQAFGQMTSMDDDLSRRLCELATKTWQPALVRQDFAAFSAALYEFGLSVGRFFAPFQGGPFAHPQMERLVAQLRERGVAGVAQTSWGPTIAALCADERSALDLQRDIATDPRWSDCSLRCVAPLNRGATVT